MFPLPLPWFKIGAVVALLVVIGLLYWWISSAFDERDRLKALSDNQETQIQGYQQAMARDAQVRETINDAIGKIKATNNTIIQQIFNDPPPTAGDGDVIRLFGGGVPTKNGMPTMINYSGGR
jgi:hypothetical protein